MFGTGSRCYMTTHTLATILVALAAHCGRHAHSFGLSLSLSLSLYIYIYITLLVCLEDGELLKEHLLHTAEDALLAFAALDSEHQTPLSQHPDRFSSTVSTGLVSGIKVWLVAQRFS